MNSAPLAKIKTGTCGWSYEIWNGVFYPPHLPPGQRLAFYARHFDSVEIDSTFYNTPSAHVVAQWLDVTPEDFVFSAKLSREITHDRKLRNCDDLLAEFLDALAPLHRKLGCVVVQLPPFFTPKHDEQSLREFVFALPHDFRFAIEFRDPAWHLPRIAHLLEEHRVCWVWNDITPIEKAEEAPFDFLPRTTDFLHLRLLGDFEAQRAGDPGPIGSVSLPLSRAGSLESWALKLKQHIGETGLIQLCAGNQFEGFAPMTAQRIAAHFGLDISLPDPGKPPEKSEEEKKQLDLL